MTRRGRCRCGAVLRFEKGSNGYKTRCPSCGSVVRLRPAAARSKVLPRRSVTCPCGASVTVPKGTTKASCPACQRELILSKKPSRSSRPAKSIQDSHGPQALPTPDSANFAVHSPVSTPDLPTPPTSQFRRDAPRTVTCEVCQRGVSARAVRCPGCGASLDRTTAASSLQGGRSAVPSLVKTAVGKSSPYKLVVGCIAAGTGFMGLIALILRLWH
jgi:predicted RNA-binding Zn-ribbon protein involved in translation (DUF1610 family)